MEIERALQQLELLQKKLYAYHCADSSLYLDAVTTAPSDTSEGRGVAMSILAGESQKLMTCPETKALPGPGSWTSSTAAKWRSCAAAVSS